MLRVFRANLCSSRRKCPQICSVCCNANTKPLKLNRKVLRRYGVIHSDLLSKIGMDGILKYLDEKNLKGSIQSQDRSDKESILNLKKNNNSPQLFMSLIHCFLEQSSHVFDHFDLLDD